MYVTQCLTEMKRSNEKYDVGGSGEQLVDRGRKPFSSETNRGPFERDGPTRKGHDSNERDLCIYGVVIIALNLVNSLDLKEVLVRGVKGERCVSVRMMILTDVAF